VPSHVADRDPRRFALHVLPVRLAEGLRSRNVLTMGGQGGPAS
jgi:hypothetical protein